MMEYAVLRIIDANVNRAREALRVMEEYARLGLEDAGLAADLKALRHAVAGLVEHVERGSASGAERTPDRDTSGLDSELAERNRLIAHRDIVGDVGCNVSAQDEYDRADQSQVAAAAGMRLGEALRVVEEYGKTIDPGFAAEAERLRYRGYDLERRLTLTAMARSRLRDARLYVLITESLCSADWESTAEAALSGGADCLQLREKELEDRELLRRARRLAALCRRCNALFIVNDRPDIALLSNAHGVHLGQGDVTVADARRIMPASMLVGVSTHTPEQLAGAIRASPDYIAVGPMFRTPTKPQDHIAGPQALAAARARTSLPLVGVGGIDALNAPEVLSAAPCCLCVCRSVIAQADVAGAARCLRALADDAGMPRSRSGLG